MFTGIFKDKISQANAILNDDIQEPQICNFVNSNRAIEMLREAISGDKGILIHCDVDVDGIGSGYIMYKFLALENNMHKVRMLINKEREHGITPKFVEVINSLPNIGLVIILDSSSNEIGLIEQVNTNVLVVDHHHIEHSNLCGDTQGGKYVIVNNMVSGAGYIAEPRMSAGLVTYELLRRYYYGKENKLDAEKMFNWVAVTLITDAILLDNERNQYYLQKSINADEIETNLQKLLLECKQTNLCKNSIQWYLAPRINSAIRAHKSVEALNCVVYNPSELSSLEKYKDRQSKYIKSAEEGLYITDTTVIKNLTDSGIDRAYCGVIASNLSSKYHKNCLTFVNDNGVCKGSFRGRYTDVRYLDYFKQNMEFAQGHEAAFGFRCSQEKLIDVVNNIPEPTGKRSYYITAGDMPKGLEGKYHIPDKQAMDLFKKERQLLYLSLFNSRLSSQESINIVIPNRDLEYTVNDFGIYTYNIKELGIQAISFDTINTQFAILYTEFSNGINIYIKELNG